MLKTCLTFSLAVLLAACGGGGDESINPETHNSLGEPRGEVVSPEPVVVPDCPPRFIACAQP